MKSLYLLFFGFLFSMFLSPTEANGQESSKKKRSSEVGLNITNTLAGFFNAGGTDLPTDPFLLSYKRVNELGALRFGTNFKVTKRTVFQDNGQLDLTENSFFFRGGYEWRNQVDKRFIFYYGFDAVLEYENEQSKPNNNGFENLSLVENVLGVGGGPILGVIFRLNDRVAFSTEGSIYGIISYNSRRQELGNGLDPLEQESTEFRLSPSVPSSLYAIFSF